MAALVDLDLNCRPPSPEPAVAEEPRRAMLRQEQSFPDQTKDLHKFYGSFWNQSNSAESSLHFEHKLERKKARFFSPVVQIDHAEQRFLVPQTNLDSRANQSQEAFTNFNKRKSAADIGEQNPDVRTLVRRKPDAYRCVIDLEKPTTSGDVMETVGCSGFGNLANQNGRSQDDSCCISPENSSLADPAQLCRDWNSSRVSPGSVGSSDTPDCQSPIKTNNTESTRSLIDLNVPQEESLFVSSASTYPGTFSVSPREVSEAECGSGIGSRKGSSVTNTTPNSFADRDVVTESSVQRKGLFDLNVSLEGIEMPSEIISDYRDKVVNNDVSKGTAPGHSFSRKNRQQAETSSKYLAHGDDLMLASKDDNTVLLPTSTNNDISKVQSPESRTINKDFFIPESSLVDNNVPRRLCISYNGAPNLQEVSMLQAKASDDDTAASIAARTLLSIFRHKSACTEVFPGSSSQTAAQNGNNEPQPSFNSFEEIVLNLEEIKDDGQSINVTPPDKEGPSCGIKLKRGRGMRNFQREIMPGLVSLARQEICEDLEAIGYEPKKTRSRKTCKGQGASSSRSRPRKRGSTARN